MTTALRVRYAPSPTGHLHIGGARTALFDYLMARKHGGQFVIRFEDTDQTRHVESGVDSQLAGLRWLGLDWDESVDVGGPYAPYRQTERLDLYRPYTEKLLADGHAYYCYCTEEELERERAEQEARGEMIRYSGRCRHLTAEERARFEAEGRKPSIRFRVPEGRVIGFDDLVREHVEFESDGIGDFIIVRPDGIPTYNFAVVLDDHLMKITHVIRGEEHLSNTPRQLLIYEALGVQPPKFAHLALILNQDRKKMSKRDESIIQFIEQYRDLGYLPEAVMNFIALLGWSPKGEEEIFDKASLIEQFDLDRVSKSPAVFDMDKLNWMNNHYMKQADLGRIVELAIPHLQRAGRLPQELSGEQRAWAEMLIGLFRDQLRYAAEIVPLSELFFRDEVEPENEEAAAVLREEQVPAVLAGLLAQVESAAEWTPDAVKAALKQVQKETGHKGKSLFMPIRVALTGQTHGPDLAVSICLLGRERVAERLRRRL
ncbi:glutamate--tRNA ligase [Paenibacillus thermoaerophilus]|uniref:Glutamate--tRNA ligase n=1 Tax=Paenibacillus thermoaerophilus TaxID=1215385 RepID=A0ABW2V475_9BACL|nr:glutamate--tRNA ligase [Paenibacillus thermoaerophilus]TMV10988.1 glutamate--tRNA ligase [Paenibacillus thermoaerophilus]